MTSSALCEAMMMLRGVRSRAQFLYEDKDRVEHIQTRRSYAAGFRSSREPSSLSGWRHF